MEELTARNALRSEREKTLARINDLRAEFEAIVAGSRDMNTDDEHDPEGSTIAFDRAQTHALLNEAEAYLAELDRACARLVDGSYSVCEVCGNEIGSERLTARPAARTCIGCATSNRSA
jgi:DnaK suppressor protein